MSESPVASTSRSTLLVVGAVVLGMLLGIAGQFVHGPVRLVLALLYLALTVPAAALAVILRSRRQPRS